MLNNQLVKKNRFELKLTGFCSHPSYYLILEPNWDLYVLKFKMHMAFEPTTPFLGIYLEIYLHMPTKTNVHEYSLPICL